MPSADKCRGHSLLIKMTQFSTKFINQFSKDEENPVRRRQYSGRHLFCGALRDPGSICFCITNWGSGYKIHDFIWLLLFFRFFVSALLSFSHHDLRSYSREKKLILLVTCFLYFRGMRRCRSFCGSARRRCWSRRFFIRIVGSGWLLCHKIYSCCVIVWNQDGFIDDTTHPITWLANQICWLSKLSRWYLLDFLVHHFFCGFSFFRKDNASDFWMLIQPIYGRA